MQHTQFNINIDNNTNNFIVEVENDYKCMKCKYYINYDTDYNYLLQYIKDNGSIDVNISLDLDNLTINTCENKYEFEDTMFDGDIYNSDDIEEYELGKNVYDFYCYYFYD